MARHAVKNAAVFLAAAMLALVSFGQDKAAAKTVNQAKNPIVTVNGITITRGDVDRYVEMMAQLLKHKRRSTTPKVLENFKKKNLKPLSDELYQRTLIASCLAKSNIVVSAEIRAQVEKESVRSFGKRGQTFADLKEYMDKAGFGADFEKNIDFDARLRTFETTVRSNEYYASEAYLDKVRADVAAYNAIATATNALAKAKARKVMERARSGEDFAKLVEEFTEEPEDEREPGGEMGDCDESDFPADPHVWRALSGMNAGEVSDVLETETGFEVFKVIRRNTPEESQTGGESLLLAHVFFRRAYLFPPQSDEEFKADVEQEMREKLLANIFKEFRAQSEVVYHNGPAKAK